jgi:hypothetical protein
VKKVARLKWIEEVFGRDYVLPYRVCRDLTEINLAIARLDEAKRTWGMRTDFKDGAAQGFNLPFVHHGTPEKAAEVWGQYGEKLVYIVSENVLRRRYSAVAVKMDPEHIFFEWNDKEPEISQRAMYKNLGNLRRIVVGPNNLVFREDGISYRSVRPEYTSDLKFDEIYDIMVHFDVKETTFTLREDGKLVVW